MHAKAFSPAHITGFFKAELEKEYNFGEHKQNVIEKSIKKYGDIYSAVFEMDAKISSLQVQCDALDEMIDWDAIEKEAESEEE